MALHATPEQSERLSPPLGALYGRAGIIKVMIDSYSFGHIVIDGVSYDSDVIIFPEEVQSSWWRKDGHGLCEGDLETVFAFGPETLIVGTGKLGVMKVPKETRELIESKGIELLVMRTSAACDRFNDLASSKKVAGAFHLTC